MAQKNKLPYSDIEILVYAYQEGSKDAIETLLKHYEGYFRRFLDVLKAQYTIYHNGKPSTHYSKFDIYDSVQRRFAGSFMRTRQERVMVQTFRKNHGIRSKMYRTLGRIRHLFENHDGQDLLQVMRLIFMEMAQNHTGEKFYNYISTTFPKILLNELVKTISDIKEELFDEEEAAEYGYLHIDEYEVDKPRLKYTFNPLEDSVYDINWINGDCEEIFSGLTPQQRTMLKMYYEADTVFPKDFEDQSEYKEFRRKHRCTDTDIAIHYGCSRKTINIARLLIVDELHDLASDRRILKE